MKYLHVKNWSIFQHYKDRNPPWIKLKTDVFQDYDFSCLQDASKLLAICYWTIAARSKDGSAPADLDYIKKQCGLSDYITIENLKELINKGFLIDASNSLADCKQSASPETERERYSKEVEKERDKEKNTKKEIPLSLKKESEIEVWEESFGKLSIEHISPWVEDNGLNPNLVKAEIETFRLSCQAKGYKYKSFPAAFKKWGCDKTKCKLPQGGRNDFDKWRA